MKFFFNNLLFQLTIFQICFLVIFINGNVLKRNDVDTATEATAIVDPSAVVIPIEMGNFVNLPTVFIDNSSKNIVNDDKNSNNLNSVTYNLVPSSNIDNQRNNIVENNSNGSSLIIDVNIIPSENIVITTSPIITSTSPTISTITNHTTFFPIVNETNIMFIETSTTTTILPPTDDSFDKITLDVISEEHASTPQLITEPSLASEESNILNNPLPTDSPFILKPTKTSLENDKTIHNTLDEVSTNLQENLKSRETEEPEDIELCLGNRHLLPRIVVNSLERQKRKLSRLINRINEQQKQHCRPDRSRYQVEYHKCPLWRSEKMAYFYQYMRLVYCDDYDKYPDSNKFKRTYGPQISLYEKMYAFHQQKI